MIPISKQESIEFFKNLYSDRNVMTICDADDNRKECDLRLTGNYQYNTLPQKVKEMLSVACNSLRGYKMYAKMDFDAYMKKDYVAKVIKFLTDNNERRIYYGNPIYRHDQFFMGGNFYAFTEQLFNDYCSCDIPEPDNWAEDYWFGRELEKCVKSKNPGKLEGTLHVINDMTINSHIQPQQTNVFSTMPDSKGSIYSSKLLDTGPEKNPEENGQKLNVLEIKREKNEKSDKEATVTATASNKNNVSGSSGAGSTLDIPKIEDSEVIEYEDDSIISAADNVTQINSDEIEIDDNNNDPSDHEMLNTQEVNSMNEYFAEKNGQEWIDQIAKDAETLDSVKTCFKNLVESIPLSMDNKVKVDMLMTLAKETKNKMIAILNGKSTTNTQDKSVQVKPLLLTKKYRKTMPKEQGKSAPNDYKKKPVRKPVVLTQDQITKVMNGQSPFEATKYKLVYFEGIRKCRVAWAKTLLYQSGIKPYQLGNVDWVTDTKLEVCINEKVADQLTKHKDTVKCETGYFSQFHFSQTNLSRDILDFGT
ncbi:hypothetical protein BB559_005682 [Furculomyces boomerangus]|nr:hypothetical protein BB559_005682 [Furculomyces boomerangus]